MKTKVSIIIFLLFLTIPASSAFAYWIWTPKTGKWINPKTAVKATPKEQFEFAKNLYELKDYEQARREFKKLLNSFPKAFEASEAQYYLGLIDEAEGTLYEAFKSYQKVIDKYPFSERITEIIEREFKIAESFMGGAKRKSLGVTLPVENPAIEIFTKVIENSTYGPLAAKAQYKLGLLFKSLGRYYEAEEAFNKVISNYPTSEWVAAAKFQLAACRAAVSKSPEYDQEAAREAKQKFEEFVKEHPDAELTEDAKKHIMQLKEREAESNYEIGRFYEKRKAYEAAKIYYNSVISANPESPWAIKAFERIRIMEKTRK